MTGHTCGPKLLRRLFRQHPGTEGAVSPQATSMTTDGQLARAIPDARATPARSTKQARVLAQLLNGLTADERTVLTLRIVARRSIEETAQQLGTSPAAVRLAQHDALDQLRRELRERLRRRDEGRS